MHHVYIIFSINLFHEISVTLLHVDNYHETLMQLFSYNCYIISGSYYHFSFGNDSIHNTERTYLSVQMFYCSQFYLVCRFLHGAVKLNEHPQKRNVQTGQLFGLSLLPFLFPFSFSLIFISLNCKIILLVAAFEGCMGN